MKIVHKKPPVLDVEAYVSAVKKSGKRPTIATLLVLCVDDHVAGGLRAGALLKDLAKLVTLDPPEPLDKFLGVSHHHVECDGLMTWVFDMRGFFQEAVENFMTDYPELKLRPVDCPNPSPLGTKELEAALAQKGKMSANAAKHLMKL
eukprot:5629094-Amphidinium_carterae.1